jgi:hypothetical protein
MNHSTGLYLCIPSEGFLLQRFLPQGYTQQEYVPPAYFALLSAQRVIPIYSPQGRLPTETIRGASHNSEEI